MVIPLAWASIWSADLNSLLPFDRDVPGLEERPDGRIRRVRRAQAGCAQLGAQARCRSGAAHGRPHVPRQRSGMEALEALRGRVHRGSHNLHQPVNRDT